MASEDLFEEELTEQIVPPVPEYDSEIEEATEQVKTTENQAQTSTGTDTTAQDKQKSEKPNEPKLLQLPFARVRNIMKLDPDLHIASNEAVFCVTRATELFIGSLARESYNYSSLSKKKTIQKKDVDSVINAVDSLEFLDGAMF